MKILILDYTTDWYVCLDGKPRVSKQIVENLDEESKTLTFREIEGDYMKIYKTFLIHLHVTTPEVGNIDIVKWTFEYEKLEEDSPHPVTTVEFVLEFTENIEKHHLNA